MNGVEKRLMQEYRRLEQDFENFLMLEANDILSETISQKGVTKYNEFHELRNEINDLLKKMIDYKSYKFYHDTFIEKAENFYKETYEFKKYFNSGILATEVVNVIKPELDKKKGEIAALQIVCNRAGYKKTSLNIKFGMEKLNKTLINILTRIVVSGMNHFENLILTEFADIDTKIKRKIEEVMSYLKSNKEEDIRLQKILDCNKMDSFLTDLGYKATRQNGSSHLIYTKIDTNGKHSVPVPQHSSLNKGLAYEIQKEVLRANN